MDAVMCPRTEYPTLSAQSNPSCRIEKQQEINIKVSAEKEQSLIQIRGHRENRNIKREGVSRQPKSIPLLNYLVATLKNVRINCVITVESLNFSIRLICAI